MGEKNSDQSIMDKSMRSVFVGNIPYEATEEKLKEIFSEVGPVLSLKLVFDRESGKSKGYGFCEYKDQETALSAMRNLNGYEIGGRTLRVDNACTEKSRMEMQQLLQGPQVENPYGELCDPDQAPEIITKTVASLPPEQMYELMKQMKLCIQNNPSEARQMLLINPQLAYALLQSMVVMRIVDPQSALGMLFKANQMPPVLGGSTMSSQNNTASMMSNFIAQNQDIDLRNVDPRILPDPRSMSETRNMNDRGMNDPRGMADRNDPRAMAEQRNMNDPRVMNEPRSMNDPRTINDSRGMSDVRGMSDPRIMSDPRMIGDSRSMNDPRSMSDMRSMPDSRSMDSRMARNLDQDMRGMPNPVPPPNITSPIDPRTQRMPQPVAPPVTFSNDPRRPADPRLRSGMQGLSGPQPVGAPQSAQANLQSRLTSNGIPSDASDQEKAALIMQVLQLSDEQIAMLPPEQRASILVLKEQIAKSTQR